MMNEGGNCARCLGVRSYLFLFWKSIARRISRDISANLRLDLNLELVAKNRTTALSVVPASVSRSSS